MTFLNEFYEHLSKYNDEKIFLFMAGKSLGKGYYKEFKLTSPGFYDVRDIFVIKNLGELSVKKENKTKNEYVFKLEDSVFKNKSKKKSCYAISGLLAGVVEKKTGKYAGAKETKCISKGDSHCEFHVKVIEK